MSIGINNLLDKVREYNPSAIEEVSKAYYLANDLHKGQYRQSGEEYIIHPLTVAYILADMHVDTDTLCAALLHDTVEDTNITLNEIEELFNKDVANLVDGVTKISRMNFSSRTDENNANVRKIVTSITNDIRIIIIKLADRLHNMRTLDFKTEYKQKENAHETLDIFVNLAYNIGAYKLKNELEDLSFKYINRYEYDRILYKRENIIDSSKKYIDEMIDNINNKLNDINVNSDSYVIYKNIYGIYKRLSSGIRMNYIHDLISIIMTTDNVYDCYLVLGAIHSLYNPINDKFKDYISRPKTNMYSSLHTTVFGLDDMLVQAQIRTKEMDNIDKNGISAYWDIYGVDAREKMQKDIRNKYQFFNSLVDINNMFPNNSDFAKKLGDELFSSKVYVYTPLGEVMELPKGSSVIDYLYKINYKDIDLVCGAFVNDELVNLDCVLKDGDRVIPIDNKSLGGPNVKWEEMAKTSYAKRKIKEFSDKSLK